VLLFHPGQSNNLLRFICGDMRWQTRFRTANAQQETGGSVVVPDTSVTLNNPNAIKALAHNHLEFTFFIQQVAHRFFHSRARNDRNISRVMEAAHYRQADVFAGVCGKQSDHQGDSFFRT
jgi:hypothetical protein